MNQNSIKQIVGRAIARYRGEFPSRKVTGHVVFTPTGFTVHTCAEKGDNVAWTQEPVTVISATFFDRGIQADWAKETHTCGNVSLPFIWKS